MGPAEASLFRTHNVQRFTSLLDEMMQAADTAYTFAMQKMSREERSADIGLGGDGTPTMFLDQHVEEPVLQILEKYGVNVLSEEIGWIDRGSAITAVIDPVDGTANSAVGVPLSAFGAAIVVDDVIIESAGSWLGTNYRWNAHIDDPVQKRVSSRMTLDGASVSMLRPRPNTWPGWSELATRAERLRILGSSVLEGCLVADGAIDAFCDPGGDIHRIVDVAPLILLVEKAGGVVQDAFGRPFHFQPDLSLRWSGVVAATPELADEICEVLIRHRDLPA
jgi:myo-inositol-1(or 4)-monophosphatase